MSRRLDQVVRRMLGLTQDISRFEAAYRHHPELGPLIVRNGGLRVPLTPTPYEAMAWAIIGQMISVSAAVSIRRRLIQAAGVRHSSGAWCFPDAKRVGATANESLLAAGLSRTKAASLTAVSALV